jgi:hypothetical protein
LIHCKASFSSVILNQSANHKTLFGQQPAQVIPSGIRPRISKIVIANFSGNPRKTAVLISANEKYIFFLQTSHS